MATLLKIFLKIILQDMFVHPLTAMQVIFFYQVVLDLRNRLEVLC